MEHVVEKKGYWKLSKTLAHDKGQDGGGSYADGLLSPDAHPAKPKDRHIHVLKRKLSGNVCDACVVSRCCQEHLSLDESVISKIPINYQHRTIANVNRQRQ